MNSDIQTFCAILRNRSEENKQAVKLLSSDSTRVLSPFLSILQQEIDSMVRVIYLLEIDDLSERQRLIKATLYGEKWKLVNLEQKLQGWESSFYRFGCAFIHLINFHNHYAENPFQNLTEPEKKDILIYMRSHHGGPRNDNPDMQEFSIYFPRLFKKVSGNLQNYLKDLEEDR